MPVDGHSNVWITCFVPDTILNSHTLLFNLYQKKKKRELNSGSVHSLLRITELVNARQAERGWPGCKFHRLHTTTTTMLLTDPAAQAMGIDGRQILSVLPGNV